MYDQPATSSVNKHRSLKELHKTWFSPEEINPFHFKDSD